VVVAFCVERAFHPTETGISSSLFKSSENIALDDGLDEATINKAIKAAVLRVGMAMDCL
jgi:hypothetical protein